MEQSTLTYTDYTIGLMCALPVEIAALEGMLDEKHPRLPACKGDGNDYTLGKIGVHNVVIVCLPTSKIGNNSAALVANDMHRTFRIKCSLMVGIGGGVWSKNKDMRLGDVAVSVPDGPHPGVVQWDFGKIETGGFKRTGSLNKPQDLLLNAVRKRQTSHLTRDGDRLPDLLCQKISSMGEYFPYQGAERDQLYKETYSHQGGHSCDLCDVQEIVKRPARDDLRPKIHYGTIASGNSVVKNAMTRDRLAKEEGYICFEMEAAGLMDRFRSLVIRGICDYADSHKNKDWQPYAAATAAAVAKEVLGFIDKQEVVDAPVSPSSIQLLPFGRNKDFVGRRSQLDRLIKILYTEDTKEDCQRAALAGLGGVGKTQIALELAFEIKSKSPLHSFFWVRASDLTSFESAYREIGKRLEIPGIHDDKADVKSLVRERLCQEDVGRWLLIVDNADDSELIYRKLDKCSKSLYEYLPFSPNGAILFTTRDRGAATRYAERNVIVVDGMDDVEARNLLHGSLQDPLSIEDEDGTRELLYLLVNLPLAIAQATAYINEKVTTIAHYIRIYKESDISVVQLLNKNFEDRRRYPGSRNPIATTWLISFHHIETRDRLAARYMSFMSCIDEQDIPGDLLPPARSELENIDAIGILKSFMLISEREGGSSYDMHRLVHIAMRAWLEMKRESTKWNKKTLKRIAKVFPMPDQSNRAIWERYLPHANYILDTTRTSSSFEEMWWSLRDKVGGCSFVLGKYADAVDAFSETLKLKEQVLGPEHLKTLDGEETLADTREIWSQHRSAVDLHLRVLTLPEQGSGPEHLSTLDTEEDFGSIIERFSEPDAATDLIQQSSTLLGQIIGSDHGLTVNSEEDLERIGRKICGPDAVTNLHPQLLALMEKAFGPGHPSFILLDRALAQVREQMSSNPTDSEQPRIQTPPSEIKNEKKEHRRQKRKSRPLQPPLPKRRCQPPDLESSASSPPTSRRPRRPAPTASLAISASSKPRTRASVAAGSAPATSSPPPSPPPRSSPRQVAHTSTLPHPNRGPHASSSVTSATPRTRVSPRRSRRPPFPSPPPLPPASSLGQTNEKRKGRLRSLTFTGT
ncbi:MAG: hypothetical protein M1818_001839 [Claussenomyces sp. TS43310]|nr:MAG: hypothetical protein M1818_001839 [Claussenomyces sp. TS43310]